MLLLVPIVVFFGYILGILLKKYIPEEQKATEPYLFWIRTILLAILIITLLYTSFSFSFVSLFFFLAGIGVAFFFKETYFYLGLSLLTLEFLPAVVCFLYGLCTGERKNSFKNALLFFCPFLLFLLPLDLIQLKIFAAGSLLILFFKKR